MHHQLEFLPGADLILSLGQAHVDPLIALQRQGLAAFPGRKDQRQDAHANQVGAVDALEALCDDGAHAQKASALGRPIPA